MTTTLAPPPEDSLRAVAAPAAARARRGPVISIPRAPPRERVLGRPLLISLAVHLAGSLAIGFFLRIGPVAPPSTPEGAGTRVDFIDIGFPAGGGAGSAEPLPMPPLAGAADGASSPPPPSRRGEETGGVRFPGRAAAPAGPATSDGGTGDGAAGPAGGGGGAVSDRLRPGFRDPRLYVDPSLPRLPPKGVQSEEQRYAEHIRRRIEAVNDSMYGGGPNTDWTTTDREGRRWGLSEKGLHLGGITVPREVLPLPRSTGTNADQEAAREKQRQRDEIRRQEEDRERRRARETSNEETRARKDAERENGDGAGG